MRINQRLDWRALALLGALLSSIIGWKGLVFGMPALIAMSESSTDNAGAMIASHSESRSYRGSDSPGSSGNNSHIQSESVNHSDSTSRSYNYNHSYSYNYSYSYHILNSDSSIQSDHSLNQNKSISAELIERTIATAIQATTAATATQDPSSSTSTTAATLVDDWSPADPLGFVISSAPREHLAILSRTERSIRHQQQQQLHHQQLHQHRQLQQQQQQQFPAPGSSNSNSNFIGSKSKRLNNYRNNLHINSSSNSHPFIPSSSNNDNNSNLDRNERSTLSHLAGPSRKIHLYIKNHFLQLLPDGTVNGTQDETSEHSEYIQYTIYFIYFFNLTDIFHMPLKVGKELYYIQTF